MMKICLEDIDTYRQHLLRQEKAQATICRYIKCIMNFYEYWVGWGREDITRDYLLEFKRQYQLQYSISSTNLEITALNSFFSFLGVEEFSMSTLKCQKNMFRDGEVELGRQEMKRLYEAARRGGSQSLPYVLLCTLSGTGVRVSELSFITVEALTCGYGTIYLKGKARIMPLPAKLLQILRGYCRKEGITEGVIFRNRNGEALHRSQVWRVLKRLAGEAGVPAKKVFPHNFRHLFAVAYYEISRDICELANLLGHTSIETTRIYLQKSMGDCVRTLGAVFSRWDNGPNGPKKKKMQRNIHSVAW